MPAAAAVATVASAAIGASSASKAAKKSANAITQASDEATALQRETYYDQRALLAPTMRAGAEAQARRMLMQGIPPAQVRAFLQETNSAIGNGGSGGANGGTPDWTAYVNGQPDLAAAYNTDPGGAQAGRSLEDFGQWHYQNYGQNEGRNLPYAQAQTSTDGSDPYAWIDDWSWESNSPSYQFRFDEGQRALERSKAAGGDYFSGDTATALQHYGQDYASNEWEADWRRFGDLAGDGTEATGTTVNVAGQFGNAAANNAQTAGRARASGYQQAADAWDGFWNDTVPGAIGAGYGYGTKQGWW